MRERAGGGLPPVQWAVASRPLDRSARCGDQAVVAQLARDVLLAVIDGLGHGDAAADVAARAASVLEAYANEALSVVVERCHAALLGTRGAALSLAALSLQRSTLTWTGVGNVGGVLVRAHRRARQCEYLTPGSGIVGVQLPSLRPATLPVGPGDTLVLATDGLRPDWSDGLRSGDPRRLTEQLLARYGLATDDALVLAARFSGDPA